LLIPKTKSESTAETAKGYSAVRVPTALVWCSELGLGYCCTTSKHSWGRNGEHQAPRTQYLEASCCSALPQNQLSQRVSINTEHTRGDRSHIFRLRLRSCPKFFNPVSSEISDFTPCAHAYSSILLIKYAEKL